MDRSFVNSYEFMLIKHEAIGRPPRRSRLVSRRPKVGAAAAKISKRKAEKKARKKTRR